MIFDDKISKEALEFVKKHKKEMKEKFAGDSICSTDKTPVSIFMAGSPGAGKTEFSKRFLQGTKIDAVRIDADEIRDFIPQYNGKNAVDVQGAAALGVEYLYDYVLKKKKSMILDATFADYEKSCKNIERSLNKGRHTEIYYLYQDPLVAWNFTKIREKIEGRFVPKEVFVESLFKAKENVDKVKNKFGSTVQIHLIIKDFDNNLEKFRLNVETVDKYLKINYTFKSLMEEL